MHYGRTRGLKTEVQRTDLACQRWGCHSNHNAASWICITLKSIFFPKETDVSFSSQHEAAWETNRGCTIKVPCLQNHQLSCRRQEGVGEQGRHRTWWQGAAGLSSVPASARGYFRHIWQHFISEVPKMSCSVPAKFQTCARHQHESPNHLGTDPLASQRRRHLQWPCTEEWNRGSCCSHCQRSAQGSWNWGALAWSPLENCGWRDPL